MNAISRNLKTIRKDKGLTQRQMAEALSVTQQTVSNWEQGRAMPTPDTLMGISARLDVDVNYILYGKPQQRENGYLKLFAICAVGIILQAVFNSLRPRPGAFSSRDTAATRLYNIMGFHIAIICSPMIYIPPAVALAKCFRGNFITRETLLSKHAGKIHKVLFILFGLYTGFMVFTMLDWFILPDVFTIPRFFQPLWQILFLSYGKWPFILGGILWGLRGGVQKIIEPAPNNTHRKNTIAVNLKNIREKSNLTQTQMAEKLFVTQQTVSNWEKGRAMPDLARLMDIAEKMKVEIYDLLYTTPAENKKRKIILYTKAGLAVILCLLWLVCDGTIFHNLPGLQAPVTSKPAIFYFSTIALRKMVVKTLIKPLLFFIIPRILFDYLKINNAVKIKSFRYAGLLKRIILLLVLLYITGLVPVLVAELEAAVRLHYANLWLKVPDISLPALWQSYTGFIGRNIAYNHPEFFLLPGIVYGYVTEKDEKQP